MFRAADIYTTTYVTHNVTERGVRHAITVGDVMRRVMIQCGLNSHHELLPGWMASMMKPKESKNELVIEAQVRIARWCGGKKRMMG